MLKNNEYYIKLMSDIILTKLINLYAIKLIKRFLTIFIYKLYLLNFYAAQFKHTSLLLHQLDFLSSGTFHVSFTLIINVTLS